MLKHGHSPKSKPTPEYRAWQSMKSRCTNPEVKCYARYGGRGVSVCKRWLNSFENFLADVGPRLSPRHTLDRYPDNDGNYEPDNVRWATRAEQQNNRRNTIFVSFQGIDVPLIVACKALNLKPKTVWMRIDRGRTPEEAIGMPRRKYGEKSCG